MPNPTPGSVKNKSTKKKNGLIPLIVITQDTQVFMFSNCIYSQESCIVSEAAFGVVIQEAKTMVEIRVENI